MAQIHSGNKRGMMMEYPRFKGGCTILWSGELRTLLFKQMAGLFLATGDRSFVGSSRELKVGTVIQHPVVLSILAL